MDDQPPNPLTLPSHERERAAASEAAPARQPQPAIEPPAPRSTVRSALWLLLLLCVIGGAIAWIVLRAGQQTPTTGRFTSSGPMPVGTAKATKGEMPVVLSGLGTVTPLAIVTVKTQIAGQLVDVAF